MELGFLTPFLSSVLQYACCPHLCIFPQSLRSVIWVSFCSVMKLAVLVGS
jgi:hypothetical protein